MSTDNDIADNQARESGGVGTSVEIGTANHDSEIKDCDKIPNAKLNHERNRGNFAHKMTNKNKRDQNQKGDEARGKKIRRRNDNSSLTISLMLITVAFLVLSISGGILNGIGQSDDPNMTVTEKEIAQLQAEIMSVLNNSMNFLFYFISGRLFRATFKKTFIAPVAKCLCKHWLKFNCYRVLNWLEFSYYLCTIVDCSFLASHPDQFRLSYNIFVHQFPYI